MPLGDRPTGDPAHVRSGGDAPARGRARRGSSATPSCNALLRTMKRAWDESAMRPEIDLSAARPRDSCGWRIAPWPAACSFRRAPRASRRRLPGARAAGAPSAPALLGGRRPAALHASAAPPGRARWRRPARLHRLRMPPRRARDAARPGHHRRPPRRLADAPAGRGTASRPRRRMLAPPGAFHICLRPGGALRMADEKTLKDVAVWSGHRDMTLEDIAVIQPGLGRIMPEIGARAWKVFYAAKARNWPLARFQAKEIRGLMELAAFTRPKYEENLNQFLAEDWKPLEEAIAREDFPAAEAAFHKAVEKANAYHELRDKPYIKWKLPETPPPDLDLTPRRK